MQAPPGARSRISDHKAPNGKGESDVSGGTVGWQVLKTLISSDRQIERNFMVSINIRLIDGTYMISPVLLGNVIGCDKALGRYRKLNSNYP